MAKKKADKKIDKYAAGLFLRTEQYADKVRGHYSSALEEMLKISANAKNNPEEAFSFGDNKKLSNKVNGILRGLYSAVYNEIKNGVEAEWEYANISCDALIESIFGKGLKENNHFARWFSRNQEAMDAFFNRKSKYGGLNLSQRVWKYTADLKTEMELALSLSLGQGDSASTVSRKVRQYLQNPDKLFRRIKVGVDKDGKPLYKLSKAAKAYHPGRGVYRSSYKNAMRLTRTETNMAYRASEQDRWKRMDFVVGYEITRSKRKFDCSICESLKGKYPKDFVFNGWHPQCRCVVLPILATEDEFIKAQQNILDGKESALRSVNEIKRPHEGFYKWWDNNKDRVESATVMPYWVQDNIDIINKKKKIKVKTEEEREAIRQKWAERAKKHQLVIKMANNVLKVAQEYPEIDLTALKTYADSKNIVAMEEEARRVAKSVVDIKKREKGVADLIPDVHELIKQFSIADLETAHSSIIKTLNRWEWDFESMDKLSKIHDALTNEIRWMESRGRKYATWKVSRDAYQRKLTLVEHRIRMLEVKNQITSELDFVSKSKSKPAQQLVQEFDLLFKADSTTIDILKGKANAIKEKVRQLESIKKRRESKIPSPSVIDVNKSDDEIKKDFINWAKTLNLRIKEEQVVLDNGFVHLQDDQHERIYNALNRHILQEQYDQAWKHVDKSVEGTKWGGYIRTSNSFKINRCFRQNYIVGDIDERIVSKLKSNGLTDDDVETIKYLDKIISEHKIPVPFRVTRYVKEDSLTHIFGETIDGSSNKEIVDSILKSKRVIQTDPAYLSASTNESQNVFTHFDVKLEIEVPPETPFMLTRNFDESEVIFGRSTGLKFISAQEKDGYVVIRARIQR